MVFWYHSKFQIVLTEKHLNKLENITKYIRLFNQEDLIYKKFNQKTGKWDSIFAESCFRFAL